MSGPDKIDPARVWLIAEELLAEEDDERLLKLTPEERQAEFERRGVKPGTAWSADEIIAGAVARAGGQGSPASIEATAVSPLAPEPAISPPAPLEPAPPALKLAPVVPIRRTWRLVALCAAACVALFVIFKVLQPSDIVSHPPPPSDRETAEAHRDVAIASCALKEWAMCKRLLDEAARLDPAGESEERVQKARAEVASGMASVGVDAGGTGP